MHLIPTNQSVRSRMQQRSEWTCSFVYEGSVYGILKNNTNKVKKRREYICNTNMLQVTIKQWRESVLSLLAVGCGAGVTWGARSAGGEAHKAPAAPSRPSPPNALPVALLRPAPRRIQNETLVVNILSFHLLQSPLLLFIHIHIVHLFNCKYRAYFCRHITVWQQYLVLGVSSNVVVTAFRL